MVLENWALNYGLKLVRDSCREYIALGWKFATDMPARREYHSHVYNHGNGRFGLCMLFSTKREWTAVKKRLTSAGFELRQDGDTEGTFLFEPTDARSRLALEVACIAHDPLKTVHDVLEAA